MQSKDSKPQDLDTKSIISMQELDPSPVDDESITDVESGEYFPKTEEDKPKRACGFPAPKLGLRAHRWDALCMLINSRETLQVLMKFEYSVGLPKILNLSSHSVLHPPLRQHLSHSAHNPVRPCERALPLAHATSLPGPWAGASRPHRSDSHPHCLWSCVAQYPCFASRPIVRRRDTCATASALFLASILRPSSHRLLSGAAGWSTCSGQSCNAIDGGGW